MRSRVIQYGIKAAFQPHNHTYPVFSVDVFVSIPLPCQKWVFLWDNFTIKKCRQHGILECESRNLQIATQVWVFFVNVLKYDDAKSGWFFVVFVSDTIITIEHLRWASNRSRMIYIYKKKKKIPAKQLRRHMSCLSIFVNLQISNHYIKVSLENLIVCSAMVVESLHIWLAFSSNWLCESLHLTFYCTKMNPFKQTQSFFFFLSISLCKFQIYQLRAVQIYTHTLLAQQQQQPKKTKEKKLVRTNKIWNDQFFLCTQLDREWGRVQFYQTPNW